MKSHSDDKRPFCVVPVRAVSNKTLLETDRRVLMALGYYANRAGVCWPSVRSLCDVAGVEGQAVQAAIKRLVKAKMIRQLQPNDYDQKQGQWGHSNRYQVLWTEDDPLPTWEQIRDANLLQPHDDRDPVITEGSGVRGTEADSRQAAIMIRAFDQAIEATIGVRPTRQPGDEAIAARLAAAGVQPVEIVCLAGRLQREAAASRLGLVSMAQVEAACTKAIRSDGVCTGENQGDRREKSTLSPPTPPPALGGSPAKFSEKTR